MSYAPANRFLDASITIYANGDDECDDPRHVRPFKWPTNPQAGSLLCKHKSQFRLGWAVNAALTRVTLAISVWTAPGVPRAVTRQRNNSAHPTEDGDPRCRVTVMSVAYTQLL
ncbi:unnamed protein product, partial [Iphiclides podalirius]